MLWFLFQVWVYAGVTFAFSLDPGFVNALLTLSSGMFISYLATIFVTRLIEKCRSTLMLGSAARVDAERNRIQDRAAR